MPGSWGERSWRNAERNRGSWQKLLKKALDLKGAVVPMMMMMMMMMKICIKTLKTLLHVSITRSSSGNIHSSLLKL